MPFVNMSGDTEQEYFADGITEDLITALSRIRWFFVIARNSCFAYKGQSSNVRDVARRLGVAYVLEGSVRKAGGRASAIITAQLIDGGSGNHVWAQRYDRDLADIFVVQDEITSTLVGAIEPELGKAERERARAKRPDDLRAWDLYQRGLWHAYKRTREDLAEAQHLFRQAIEIEPGMARAYAAAEEAFFFQFVGGYVDAGKAAKADALRFAEKAVQLDRAGSVQPVRPWAGTNSRATAQLCRLRTWKSHRARSKLCSSPLRPCHGPRHRWTSGGGPTAHRVGNASQPHKIRILDSSW